MAANSYVPRGLPLLSDAALVKMMKDYGRSYAALSHSVFPSAARLRKDIGLGILAIEEELSARGIAATTLYQDRMVSSGVIEQKTSIKEQVGTAAFA